METRARILDEARTLVKATRQHAHERSLLDKFLAEFRLSSDAGVALMCICEALLRIPDAGTAEALLKEKLASANWHEHLGNAESVFLNASTWALLLTGKTFTVAPEVATNLRDWITKWVAGVGESVARTAMSRAVQIVGSEFVFGRTIEEALTRTKNRQGPFSFDMLGEGARTYETAQHYFNAYAHALEQVAEHNHSANISSGLSIKLSALHPRYEPLQRKSMLEPLVNVLLKLLHRAAELNIDVSIDAEEAERLEVSLDVFEALVRSPQLAGWEGLGFVVQGYSKRAVAVIDWLESIARKTGRSALPVRLVKGAYWDSEIKRAQLDGLDGYPVFTRKAATDFAWLAALARLFDCTRLYPQVATHNAYAIAAAINLSNGRPFEYQRLHGMGELLYKQASASYRNFPVVRTYAPVGDHRNLLSYLVRRLLENGANASFVNRLLDNALPIEKVVLDPMEAVTAYGFAANPQIPLPCDLYGESRVNSKGIDLGDQQALNTLWSAVNAETVEERPIEDSHTAAIEEAFKSTQDKYPRWSTQPVSERRRLLDRLAENLEAHTPKLLRLLRDEAGKTLLDAHAELREAVDFCRYYGSECEREFKSQTLVGPTGERNTLAYQGRGVFVCISPWNFPLAIFLGQISAALAAGNTVIAKPAEQTPQIATFAIELLHEAGFPRGCVELVYGGADVGAAIVRHAQTAGVAFTGSVVTAKSIQRSLAEKDGPIVPFIAETGGVNVMIVDSSVLLEQTVDDVLTSAFRSTGQRCSALRLLCLQDDIAEAFLVELTRAVRCLKVGDSKDLSTDVGPVIDRQAKERIEGYLAKTKASLLYRGGVEPEFENTHLAPTILSIDAIEELTEEVFGPVLHVYRYPKSNWKQTLTAVRDTGYGLTFGVQTRIEGRAHEAAAIVGAGNVYVNQNMIGATVGVQPFGGHGLSGTGPKAGGPNYLKRFAREAMVTENIVATGGNHELLRLEG